MVEKYALSKESFLGIADAAGMRIDHSHFEDLYTYLQGLLPPLKAVEEIDLTGWEPFMPSLTKKEEPR